MQLFFLNQNLPDLSLSHKVTEATLAYDGFGGRKGAEVGFLKGQTKLEWHLGQVGPKKIESLVMKQFFFLWSNFKTFWSNLAKVAHKLGPFFLKIGLSFFGFSRVR